ncbi:hypothetical protein PanWU01x14_242010, partial [Parasponia andersonii]
LLIYVKNYKSALFILSPDKLAAINIMRYTLTKVKSTKKLFEISFQIYEVRLSASMFGITTQKIKTVQKMKLSYHLVDIYIFHSPPKIKTKIKGKEEQEEEKFSV